MACSSCNWEAAKCLGSQAGQCSLLGLLNSNQRWTCKAQQVLFAVWQKACLCHCAWYIFFHAPSFSNTFHLLTSIALHPYFKLAYIEIAWGGPVEQDAECNGGNPHAKDWQDEAQKILKHMVCTHSLVGSAYLTYISITDGALLQEPAQSETNTDSSPQW